MLLKITVAVFPYKSVCMPIKLFFGIKAHFPKLGGRRIEEKHALRSFNPDISTTFFRAGLIEAWGRRTVRIIFKCLKYGIPVPIFNYDFASFSIEFQPEKLPKKPEIFLTDNQKGIIELIN